MSRPTNEEVLALLEQGIAMCGRWEDLSDQQFDALSAGDVARLSTVSVGQSRLADQFKRLEWQWHHITATMEDSPTGDLTRARQEFVAVVNRMHGINARNAKALMSMVVLGDMYRSMTSVAPSTYTSAGEMSGKETVLPARLDREG